jgi:hypothetical protein
MTKKRDLSAIDPLFAELVRAARASDMSLNQIESRAGVYNQFLSVVGTKGQREPLLRSLRSVGAVLGLELIWRRK